jgi:hypothetical protein
MFLELVDSLRCVRPHEDSWLIARADVLEARHIAQGELGCPVCESRYAIRDGVADFRRGAAVPNASSTPPHDAQTLALRAAALLGLTDPGGLVVLTGEWSGCADALLDLIDGVQLLALDAAPELQSGGALSLALISDVLPLAAAAARGIALDATHATPTLVAGAARALTPGGRLVAPASTLVPDSLQELARDEEHWVAAAPRASVSAPVLIALRR